FYKFSHQASCSRPVAIRRLIGQHGHKFKPMYPGSSDRLDLLQRIEICLAARAKEQDTSALNLIRARILQQTQERGQAAASCDANHRRLACPQMKAAMRCLDLQFQRVEV